MKLGKPTVMVFVTDMQRSIKFYRDILELKLRSESPEWTELDIPGLTFALHKTDRAPNPKNAPVGIGFYVQNLVETYKTLTARGVKFITPPTPQDFGDIATCVDPDGTPISLCQPR